jgi:hypothetical protein
MRKKKIQSRLTSYPLFQNNQPIYKPENKLQWREKKGVSEKKTFELKNIKNCIMHYVLLLATKQDIW